MSRTQRAIAAVLMVVVGVTGVGAAPVARADRYTDMQCFTNPAYRSMHEECEGGGQPAGSVPQPGHPGGGNNGPGGLRGVLRSIPVVGGLF